MVRQLILILIIFIGAKLFAQQVAIEDVLKQIPNSRGMEKVKALNKASGFYKLNKPDTALFLSQQALQIIEPSNEALVILSEIYGNIAESYFYLAKQDSSVRYYLKAIAIAEQINNRKKKASFYNGLGTALFQLGDFDKAIDYMQRASTIKLEDGDILYYAVINANIAAAMQRLLKFKEAIAILKDSEKHLISFGNMELLANIYNSIGSVYLYKSDIHNLDSAAYYFNKSIQLITKPEHDAFRLAAYVNLGMVYIEKEQFNDAEENLFKGLELSTNLLRNQEKVQIYELLSSIFENKGEYKDALYYKKLQNTLQDSLLTAEKGEMLNNLESQYQLEKKDLTIKQQELFIENEKNKTRIIIIALVLIIVIITTVTYILFLKKNTRETIEKEKTRFFSNVVHEFRTPLTLLKGPLLELKKHTVRKDDEENIKLIERGSERLLFLVNQLLDVSKIEAGKYMLAKDYGSLFLLVEPLLLAFKKQALDKGILLTSEINIPTSNYLFSSDAIEKIITNIISNALKHTPINGSISVSMVVDSDSMFNIYVEDNGAGISKKDLPRIFDRFYQSSQTTQTGGTGLGLSLTKELVEMMKGTISIQSELKKGTEVRIMIPLEEQTITTSEFLENNVEAIQIVLVEDDNELASFTSGLLKAEGYLVHIVNNGLDAVKVIEEVVPDVIISDIMMPGLNGLELASALKTTPIVSHIPIIGLSAKTSQESKLDALQQGMDVYISKPFHPDELILTIRNIIQTLQKNHQLFENQIKEDIKPYSERVAVRDAYIAKVIDVLKKNMETPDFSVNELADALFISRSQLHRKIKSLTGLSTTHFIRIVKLEKAKDMLKANQGNVTEVAYSCGFNSQSYFTKSFVEHFGVPPSSFLK